MTYEEKYKRAFEIAKEVYHDDRKDKIWREWLTKLFPELKESEDELTWLTKYIEEEAYSLSMDIRDNEDRLKLKKLQRSLAWLKQGEKESDPRYKYLEDLLTADDIHQMSMNEAMVEEAKSKAVNALSKLGISKLLGLEKQGKKKPYEWHSEDEQNLNAVLAFIEDEYLRRWLKDIIHTKYEQCVDDSMKEQKVEPKFKAGDCVISNDGTHTYLVKERKRGAYVMLDIGDNEEFSIIIETADRTGRFWAIQDAKDGDVLVNGSNIFIFHLNGTRLMGYCHVNIDDGRFYDDIGKIECFCTIDAIVTPATEEQRDLLFAKMRDSGYEWDVEKKELKRIESKKLNADEVIEWLNHRELRYDDVVTTVIPDDSPTSVCHKVKWLSDEFINQFKKDFGL